MFLDQFVDLRVMVDGHLKKIVGKAPGLGINFLSLLGLSGGMPTLVSVPKERMKDIVGLLGVGSNDAAKIRS
jgi:hypothetical protein